MENKNIIKYGSIACVTAIVVVALAVYSGDKDESVSAVNESNVVTESNVSTENNPVDEDRIQNMGNTIDLAYPTYMSFKELDLDKRASEINGIYEVETEKNEIFYLYDVTVDGRSTEGGINSLFGYTPEGVVDSINIVKHWETEGLGDVIETEDFLSTVLDKNIKDNPNFEVVTGATLSSTAMQTAFEITSSDFTKNGVGK